MVGDELEMVIIGENKKTQTNFSCLLAIMYDTCE